MSLDAATRTHCPYCAFQCGMLMSAGEVKGDPDFPVNRGSQDITSSLAQSLNKQIVAEGRGILAGA